MRPISPFGPARSWGDAAAHAGRPPGMMRDPLAGLSHFWFQMHRLTFDLLEASSDRADAPPTARRLESAHAV